MSDPPPLDPLGGRGRKPSGRPQFRARPRPRPRPRPQQKVKPDNTFSSQSEEPIDDTTTSAAVSDVTDLESGKRVVVKSDPDGHNEVGVDGGEFCADTVISSSLFGSSEKSVAPPPQSWDNMKIDEDEISDEGGTSDDTVKQDDNDEVVREIGVYISPSLSGTLRLLQFPLQPRHTPFNHDSGHTSLLPDGARYKPVHNRLELDYPLVMGTNSEMSSAQQSSAIANLAARTLQSQAVPLTTHLALAGWSRDGENLVLTPLRRPVLRLRPSFAHIDDDDEAAASRSGKTTPTGRDRRMPLVSPVKGAAEGVEAGGPRRTSYAELKAREDDEEWVGLDVRGPGSIEHRRQKILGTDCGLEAMDDIDLEGDEEGQAKANSVHHIRFHQGTFGVGKGDGCGTYVRTLNYRTTAAEANAAADEQDFAATGQGPGNHFDEDRWVRRYASTLAAQMIHSRGSPIPFTALWQVHCKNPDRHGRAFVTALAGSSVLLRGGEIRTGTSSAVSSYGCCFVLKSSLVTWIPRRWRTVRDVMLLLLHRDGKLRRDKLMGISLVQTAQPSTQTNREQDKEEKEKKKEEKEDEDAANTNGTTKVENEILEYLLKQLAVKSTNCWVVKYDDESSRDANNNFEKDFPEETMKQYKYWDKKRRELKDYVLEYDVA